jgi:hypothetical protein
MYNGMSFGGPWIPRNIGRPENLSKCNLRAPEDIRSQSANKAAIPPRSIAAYYVPSAHFLSLRGLGEDAAVASWRLLCAGGATKGGFSALSSSAL